MEEIRSLDWILLSTGCKIIRTRSWINALNNILLFSVVSIELFLTLVFSFQAFTSSIYFITLYIPHYAYGILFQLIMRVNRRAQYHYLKHVIARTSSARRKSLKRTSLLSAIIVIAWTIPTSASYIVYLSSALTFHAGNPEEVLEICILYMDMYLTLFGSQWLLISCLFCCYLIKATSHFEQTFMNQLPGIMKNQTTSVTDVLVRIHKVSQLKKQCMSLLGIIPCLPVLYLFFATSGLILQVKRVGFDLETGSETVIMIGYFISLIYTTYVSDQSRQEAVEKADAVTTFVLSSGREDWRQVTGPLQRLADFQHQPCLLFTLNYQFIFSFLSAFITFTVLLTQILHAVDVSKHE